MGCMACGAPSMCAGCETIAGAFSGMVPLSGEQETAMDAYCKARGSEAMRAAYLHLADVGLPLCNVEPSFGRAHRP